MIAIKEAIIVEGRYDKNKLAQIVDTTILETGGFQVFNKAEMRELFRMIADKRGLIVLTDSDAAGFMIRNHLRGVIPKDKLKHAYIPQINGKERRKTQASKEGFLGVEGMDDEIIIKALISAGATIIGQETKKTQDRTITKTDFYNDGLSGGEDSALRREKLLKLCSLPSHMTANALIEALNILVTYDEYRELVDKIK